MARILIIEDEKAISNLIKINLQLVGHECSQAFDGEEGIDEALKNKYDLVILDIMLPKYSGFEIIKYIEDTPVIFVTAKASTQDKIKGFRLGADDYIAKPFDIYELVARVKAHLRREYRSKIIIDDNILEIGEIKIIKESYETYINNKKIDISTREFEVLYYLMKNAGIVLTKEQIFDSVWGKDYGDIGTVAVHIKSLRNKIDKDEKYIKTVWGVGYKFIKVIDND